MSAPYVYTPVERASRRLGLFLLILLGLVLTVTLFFVKARAQEARADVVRLEAEIAEQERALTVLAAEQATLRNPERLGELGRERLGLAPITVAETSVLDDMPVVGGLSDADEGSAP
ncbi:hypothetical protein ACFFUB_04050 [Algimonas porphyrae]|uniref:Cell division protein FtsL n=1 Tax=Algimonas porphyrae TaxID=1128113 RepID=A0ABQ5V0B4_9PROT|nr:hypothetical protein [Algimonas porphyrae]GLQ20061.1 hypothetical protein GCM10007854_10160 [Algimonas porphyrae]